MNKLSMLLAGLCAVSMASCSSDEPAGNTPNTGGSADGKAAMYLAVNISDANSHSPLFSPSRGSDGGLEFGNPDENKVATAHFYFYDDKGEFIIQGKVWSDEGPGDFDKDPNVEYFGKSTLVLRGLTEENLPSYVITVLNAPEALTKKMDNPATALNMEATAKFVTESVRNGDNFIMSTTSFFGGDTEKYNDKYYYANKIKPGSFLKEPVDINNVDKDKFVDIYVERLAAKFSLNIPDANTDGYFPVEVSVGGNGNEGNNTSSHTNLYVKILGWDVNATEKGSRISKNLDDFNAQSNVFTDWNEPKYHRSYWGQSLSYDKANPDLKYLTFAEAQNKVEKALYAPECTNTVGNIRAKATETSRLKDANVTSVILTAQVFEKTAEGVYQPVDLVLYNGLYFTYDMFKNYALSRLNANSTLNYWFENGTELVENPDGTKTETTKYRQLDATDLEFTLRKDDLKGTASVQIVSKYTAADKVYAQSFDAEGKEKYTAIDNGVTKLNNVLKSFAESAKITAFENGSMYYSVPVEHLLGVASTKPFDVEAEANYGVVRNHHYQITVNKVYRLGNGVFKPGTGEESEELIPENPNSDTYALGATVKIVSWKIVNQSVDL